jgi:hypothetical protein
VAGNPLATKGATAGTQVRVGNTNTVWWFKEMIAEF